MARQPLVYRDYRPIKPGDIGWSAERQKARWYYSPSEKKSIPLREFQKLARGQTYTEFVKQRKRRGIQPKRYKPRKPKIVGGPPGRPPKRKRDYVERKDFLKDSFVRKVSEAAQLDLSWDDLTDDERTNFWELYHKLADASGPPTYNEYLDEWVDVFDIDYVDYEDFEYGPTP